MTAIHTACILFLFTAATKCLDEDFHSSISGMEKLLELEAHLLDNLKDYVDQEFLKHKQIDLILEHFETKNEEALNKPDEFFGSPGNVFKTLKRSVVELRDLHTFIFERNNEADFRLNLTKIVNNQSLHRPKTDALGHAVIALERLQNTYKLNALDLAEGRIFNVQFSDVMSGSDAFVMGKELLKEKHFDRSLEWLSVASTHINNQTSGEFASIDEDMTLALLSRAAYGAGKLKIALEVTKELLRLSPHDVHLQANLKRVEFDIFNQRNGRKSRPITIENAELSDTEIYEAVCRGDLKQSPSEERALRCMYANNDVPFLKIAPFKMEQLSLDPLVVFYHEVIYDKEIEKMLEASKSKLIRSFTGIDKLREYSSARTSKNTWLEWKEHDFLDKIGQRLTDMTQLSLDSSEAPQVVNYGIGGHYNVHYDFARSSNEMFENFDGNRIATALFYISDVELGGATAFPRLKLAVKPIKRSMVVWYNLHNSTDPDYRTLHAGCPVLKGSKWIFLELMHTGGQELRKPCGLQSTAYLSQGYQY